MTPQQRAAYDFIVQQINDVGIAPSYQEIAKALDLKARSNVFYIVRLLVADGHLVQSKHRARSLDIPRTCPHCGLPTNTRTAA